MRHIALLLFMTLCSALHAAESPQAVRDLLDRVCGAGSSERIVTLLDPTIAEADNETFRITTVNGKPCITGSTLSALTRGLGWYLSHYAQCPVTWDCLHPALPEDGGARGFKGVQEVQEVQGVQGVQGVQEVQGVQGVQEGSFATALPYRYYLNYCTFGYSMTTWTWERWEEEIDWMALHGINMPLQIIGMERVWRDLLIEDYGYSEDEAEDFVAGPAYIAWWGMNNLEGWGGTHDNAWYDRQAALARRICDRERELGMQPVLPGFSGMVPSNFQEKTGHDTEAANLWCRFQRPAILDPTSGEFATMARHYYRRLAEVMGPSCYYSMDPFHEGGTISSGRYADGYRAIFEAMNANCGHEAKWVIQQWQWEPHQATSLTAVPAGRLVVLDLFSDGKPAFDQYEGYAPQEAVFCALPNFGGRSGCMGRLDNMTAKFFTCRDSFPTLRGIGATPEAIESVPVVYELLFELPWLPTAPDMRQWIAEYALSRYGLSPDSPAAAKACEAWNLIRQSAMAYGADAIQGPIEDVWAARPNLEARPASTWGKTLAHAANIYTPERREMLRRAFALLIEVAEHCDHSSLRYDLIEVGSQVMADRAYDLLLAREDSAFLQLILDMDDFKGTHRMFRLGNWTATARAAAEEIVGATTATPDWYELDNARTLITTWGRRENSDQGGLHDYSYRSWQGLLRDLYYPRWQYFFSHGCEAPAEGWFPMEWDWAHDASRSYDPTPVGDTVELARKLMQR